MLRRLRACARLLAIALATFGLYGLWLAGRPIAALAAPAGTSLRWRRWIYRSWARSVCAAIGMRRRRAGDVPRPPYVLVANHLGYVDVAFLAAELGVVFVSKAEVRDWPLIGAMSASMGTLFVSRERKRELPDVNQAIARSLELGDAVVIFPEGRSTDGKDVLPFRPPLLEPAAAGAFELRCATVRYATREPDPPASRSVCWSDATPFHVHAWRLAQLERIDATVELSPRVLRSSDRKLLARDAHAEVARAFRPLD